MFNLFEINHSEINQLQLSNSFMYIMYSRFHSKSSYLGKYSYNF
jgi:hypothetical protein